VVPTALLSNRMPRPMQLRTMSSGGSPERPLIGCSAGPLANPARDVPALFLIGE